MPLTDLPELVSLESHAEGVRIPPGVTVPLTDRVRALLDTAEMRRLARVSQLGLVSLVYPGAVHSRLEHSLGVYRRSLEFLARLRHDPRFIAVVTEADAAAFVVAALVHDIGHWPFCHPIEDVGLRSFLCTNRSCTASWPRASRPECWRARGALIPPVSPP